MIVEIGVCHAVLRFELKFEEGMIVSKKTKKYPGNVPSMEDWRLVGQIEKTKGEEFLVFVKNENEAEWISIKLVARKPVKRKGNYWLAWNGERFADGHCLKALRQNRPELEEAVLEMLAKIQKNDGALLELDDVSV